MVGSPGTHPHLLGFQWLLDQANDRIRAWRTWSLGNCGEIVGGKWWETLKFFREFLVLQVVVKGEKRLG